VPPINAPIPGAVITNNQIVAHIPDSVSAADRAAIARVMRDLAPADRQFVRWTTLHDPRNKRPDWLVVWLDGGKSAPGSEFPVLNFGKNSNLHYRPDTGELFSAPAFF
jgi:hypothetical protein